MSKSEILDRMPPCDREAEQGVLGSILLDTKYLDDVMPLLQPTDFSDPIHEKIYREVVSLHESSRRVDMRLLADRFRKKGIYDLVGGVPYIAELTRKVPHAANAVYYAQIVRDVATQRAMISVATDMLRDSYEPKINVDEHLSDFERKLYAVRDQRAASTEKIVSATDLLQMSLSELEKRERGEVEDGLETGFVDLDQIFRLRPGHLVIVAGRPSMGKSALAVNIAMNVSKGLRVPAIFTTLEMSEFEIADRMVASTGRIDGAKLREPTRLDKTERMTVMETYAELSSIPVYVDFSPGRTLSDIAAACRRRKRQKGGLGLLVVDYLQLVTPADRRIVREQQVAELSRGFKALAREANIPIILLAQLNREGEKGDTVKPPRLSHLRESGSIEQDADAVLFVHRPEYYLGPDAAEKCGLRGVAEIYVAKQRGGATGKVTLTWTECWTRFDNYHPPAGDMPNYEQAFDAYSTQT